MESFKQLVKNVLTLVYFPFYLLFVYFIPYLFRKFIGYDKNVEDIKNVEDDKNVEIDSNVKSKSNRKAYRHCDY